MRNLRLRIYSIGLASLALVTTGCEQQSEPKVTSNTSAIDGMGILEAANHILDENSFKNCEFENLEPLEIVWQLDPSLRQKANEVISDIPASDYSSAAIEFASAIDGGISSRERESITMWIFKLASENGDIVADSEIGASLLFCYNHVQQDLPKAKTYLERAANRGDSYAMSSLGVMYLAGLIEEENSTAIGKK